MPKSHWSVAQAKAALSEVIRRAEAAPQVIERRSRAVAVVVSIADYESAAGKGSLRSSRWQRFLARSAQLREKGGAVLPLARREPRADPLGRGR